MEGFVKRRPVPARGSIPWALGMFRAEVRFYRQIAPQLDVRVPVCHRASDTEDGTLLVLEDLSDWNVGADPQVHAALLAQLHGRWEGIAASRWPWLRGVGAAAELVGDLFDSSWPSLAERPDLPREVTELGERLFGRVVLAETAVADAGPLTLVHGDASWRNVRTSTAGELVLLDWEDVSALPGIIDLAWLLLSSVEPERWPDVVAAYGTSEGLSTVLPAVAVQGLLCLADAPLDSAEASGWLGRLHNAQRYIRT